MKPVPRVNGSPQMNETEIARLLDIQKRYLKLIGIVDQIRKPGETSEQTLNRVLGEQKHG